MKALLDEHLSGELARILRARDLDVEAVSERAELGAASDEHVMTTAEAEGRAVVTNNLTDFRMIATRRIVDGSGHSGLILIPSSRSRSRSALGAIADAIETIMLENPDGLRNAEFWIRPPV